MKRWRWGRPFSGSPSSILEDCERLCLRDGAFPSRRTCLNCKKWAVLEEAKSLLKEVI